MSDSTLVINLSSFPVTKSVYIGLSQASSRYSFNQPASLRASTVGNSLIAFQFLTEFSSQVNF